MPAFNVANYSSAGRDFTVTPVGNGFVLAEIVEVHDDGFVVAYGDVQRPVPSGVGYLIPRVAFLPSLASVVGRYFPTVEAAQAALLPHVKDTVTLQVVDDVVQW